MFGRSVRRFLNILVPLFFALPTAAQTQKATVTNANAAIYRSPDFSSAVLGRVKAGTQWQISSKPFGLFYQIKIRNGLTGYIAEGDLSLANKPSPPPKKPSDGASLGEKRPKETKEDKSYLLQKQPFKQTNFWGIVFGLLRYREETMGLKPTDNLTMIGVNMTGPDIVISGYPTEFNFLLSTAPPRYYAEATGESVDGFLLMTNFLLQYNYPSGRNTMSFFGFGPMFKYSRWSVIGWAPKASDGSIARANQNLDDMALGVIFNAGLTMRMSNFAIRMEFDYYWEKMQYYGLNLSGQFAF